MLALVWVLGPLLLLRRCCLAPAYPGPPAFVPRTLALPNALARIACAATLSAPVPRAARPGSRVRDAPRKAI